MPRACTTCGSSDIDFDPSRGDTVCTNCGSVLEESAIVSEVGFQENSSGGASVIGQFVSNEGNKVGQGLGFRPGIGRESRTVTLENGKRRLQAIANQLQLNNHCVESAYMFFKLAVSKRLTKGRRTNHVAAACLYLVCRTERTPHLLIDFSDVLQVDVITLGRVYLKLQHELCINLPVIDPCLYIHRFSHQFQLEDKEHEVTNTALRLVSRMKRDWIQYGRRPSGLCGAALLMAARLHGFNRNINQIVKIVRLSKSTIKQRLSDFEKTPSGQLTVDEFNTIDLEEEQDPPCFTKGRQRLKQQQLGEVEGMEKSNMVKELKKLRQDIDMLLNRKKAQAEKAKKKKYRDDPAMFGTDISDESSLSDQQSSITNETMVREDTEIDKQTTNNEVCIDKHPEQTTPDKNEQILEKDNQVDEEDKEIEKEKSNGKETIGDVNSPKKDNEEEEKVDNFEDLDDDDELNGIILSATEVEVKTKVWMDENKDYLEKMKEKEEQEALEREKEENDPTKKKRRKPYKRKPKTEANTVGEAVEKMLIEKRISHKINYDVLRNLNKENELEKPSDTKPETLIIEQPVSTTQPTQSSIPVRYKGRKRDTNILPKMAMKRAKVVDSIHEGETVLSEPTDEIISKSDNVVVEESGPIEYHEDEVYDEDDENSHLSAAQLMGQNYGGTEEFEDYNDEY